MLSIGYTIYSIIMITLDKIQTKLTEAIKNSLNKHINEKSKEDEDYALYPQLYKVLNTQTRPNLTVNPSSRLKKQEDVTARHFLLYTQNEYHKLLTRKPSKLFYEVYHG